MSKTTGDRRTRKTNKAIKKALVKLMLEKDITKITIKDITEEADINRGTFYFHFSDIYEVLEQIENEIINKIYELIDEFDFKSPSKSPLDFLLKLSSFLNDDREFNKLLIINEQSVTFLNKLKELFKDKIIKDNIKNIDKKNHQLYACSLTFIASGTIDLYKEWFKGNIDMSIEELSKAIHHLVMNGATPFLTKT